MRAVSPILCTWEAHWPIGHAVVWPDGCRDLIAILARDQPPKVICSGLDAAPRRVVCASATRFVGIRLAPGITVPWDEDDPDRIRQDVDLTRCFPLLDQWWGDACAGEEIAQTLSHHIEATAGPAPGWIADYFNALRHGDPIPTPAPRGRSLRRKLVQATGAPPRYWQGLIRARKVARAVSQSDHPLVAIAADHGFADQAHMSREIRRWFGCTPMTLRIDREQSLPRLTAPDLLCIP